jgi:hypothetical protein
VSSYARWSAGATRSGGGGARSGPLRGGGPGRDHDLASDQSLLLDAIAALVLAVATYGPRGECQYRRVGGGLPADACTSLLEAMQALAQSVVSSGDRTAGTPTLERGHIGAVVRDVGTPTGRYRQRAIRLRPGLFGADASVLVVADRLPDDAVDRARIRGRFGLTEREADVVNVIADVVRDALGWAAVDPDVHLLRTFDVAEHLDLGGLRPSTPSPGGGNVHGSHAPADGD